MSEKPPQDSKKRWLLRGIDAGRPYAHRGAMAALPAAAVARAYGTGPKKTTAAIAIGAGLGIADKHLENIAHRRTLRPVLKNYAAEASMHKKADTDERVERHRAQLSDLFPTASGKVTTTQECLQQHEKQAGGGARSEAATLTSSAEASNKTGSDLLQQLVGHTASFRKATAEQLGSLFPHTKVKAIGPTAAELATNPVRR